MKKILSVLILTAVLSGCIVRPESLPTETSSTETSSTAVPAPEELPTFSSEADSETDDAVFESVQDVSIQEANGYSGTHPYLSELVSSVAKQISTPQMSEYERTKAAFDYMIQHTSLDEPIGLELWRVHGGGEEPIPFVQQRAISPLRFGVGMCEDYAAALALLLQGMGLEARYLPGLTYSEEGHLVDHAWTMVQIDGVWYHLDSQLEDNISRHGSVRYRYFLKGDATMSGSHLWGKNLIASGLLTPEQNSEIKENAPDPVCPQDYPTPERLRIQDVPAPNLDQLRQEAASEIAVWEEGNGPLPKMELNTIPPVFGLDGYGPADEG